MQERLEIGQIVNIFGIKGFLKVMPYVDDITRFEDLDTVYLKTRKESIKYQVEEVKYQKNMVLLKLKGIDKIEDAEKIRNCYLEIDRENAIKLEKNEYFIADLIGLNVITDEGKKLGKLDDIFNTGSNDIYVVKDELGKQILLPAISEVIKKINIEKEEIVVHIIDGLI